jgi:uncharacterized membrane protein YsdA (DUF1294 family)
MMDISALLIPGIFAIGLNILAFLAFALDKFKAKAKTWRIPENTLLLFAAFGPFGALAAMYWFRHKTLHVKFYLVWIFAFMHAVLVLWLLQWLPMTP